MPGLRGRCGRDCWSNGRLLGAAIAPEAPCAKTALEQLDACINYQERLKQRGGFKETGPGKVAGVEAIIHYANRQGTLLAFLEHLEQLQAQVAQARQTPHHCIRLTTIHQSKGLEWPVVIIPHCNQGTLPFGENLTSEELEEERRLLYVAITRAQKELHLYTLKPQPLSQFLQEARVAETLQRTEQLHQQLQSDPQTWQAGDVAKVVKGVASLGFDRYFRQWWTVAPEIQAAIAHTIQRCPCLSTPCPAKVEGSGKSFARWSVMACDGLKSSPTIRCLLLLIRLL